MTQIQMKCGHIANATTDTGKPCCAICNCHEIDNKTFNLVGRKAKCSWCGHIEDSNANLPFFQSKPNSNYDSYYCGCGGWD